jgi:hypothetical protein
MMNAILDSEYRTRLFRTRLVYSQRGSARPLLAGAGLVMMSPSHRKRLRICRLGIYNDFIGIKFFP